MRYCRDAQDFSHCYSFVFCFFLTVIDLCIELELFTLNCTSRCSGWKKQRVGVKASSKTSIMMGKIMWKFCDVSSLLIEAAISSSISFCKNNTWCKPVIWMSIKHIDVWCLNDWKKPACWQYKKFISRHASSKNTEKKSKLFINSYLLLIGSYLLQV